jgi:hypothetical protein
MSTPGSPSAVISPWTYFIPWNVGGRGSDSGRACSRYHCVEAHAQSSRATRFAFPPEAGVAQCGDSVLVAQGRFAFPPEAGVAQ